MTDRRRLLLITLAILTGVSLASVSLSAWNLRQALRLADGTAELWTTATWLAALQAGVLIIAAGTLLVRLVNPYMKQLELGEAIQRLHAAELERLNGQLEEKTARLTQLNAELENFTCAASHDLKEPLRGISNYCTILLEDYRDRLDDRGESKLVALVRLCDRLGRLIDDLLGYTRVGCTQPALEYVDLSSMATEVIETLQPAIEERGGRVEIVGNLPSVEADPILIGELLRNLVANGLKFNTSAVPTVEIRGYLTAGEAVIEVCDNGIGIDAQHHAEIFEFFRRLHSRQKYEGTGAGLALVRKIATSHGGRVWVQSEPTCGSTFSFSLPLGIPAKLEPELAGSAV